jgi:hypothetical protein
MHEATWLASKSDDGSCVAGVNWLVGEASTGKKRLHTERLLSNSAELSQNKLVLCGELLLHSQPRAEPYTEQLNFHLATDVSGRHLLLL